MLYYLIGCEGWLQFVSVISDAISIPSKLDIFPISTSRIYADIEPPPEDENGVRRITLVPINQLVTVYTIKEYPETSYILTNYKATMSIEESIRYIKEKYFIEDM